MTHDTYHSYKVIFLVSLTLKWSHCHWHRVFNFQKETCFLIMVWTNKLAITSIDDFDPLFDITWENKLWLCVVSLNEFVCLRYLSSFKSFKFSHKQLDTITVINFWVEMHKYGFKVKIQWIFNKTWPPEREIWNSQGTWSFINVYFAEQTFKERPTTVEKVESCCCWMLLVFYVGWYRKWILWKNR